MRMLIRRCPRACENRRNLAVVALLFGLSTWPVAAVAQSHQEGAPNAHAEQGAHGSSLSGLIWPVANFLVLVAGLRYYLRTPAAEYFAARKAQVSKDLVEAADMKATATQQLADIEDRLTSLPVELNALRERGRRETEAEQQRIAATAEAERTRLLEQTRRDIDMQVRIARRTLTEHAAALAVQLAEQRIATTITTDDHERIATRYVDQVGVR
jgi:F0F1-type ATP synthase membrane subunit b/b'